MRRAGSRRIIIVLVLILAALPAAAKPCIAGEEPYADTLFGSWGELRNRLDDVGVAFSLDYTGELFANLSGGKSTGGVYEGLAELGVEVDLEKAIGLPGFTLSLNVLNPHGKSPSAERVGDDLLVSNLDAYDTVRLQNLWIEAETSDGALAVRVGNQAVDDEFMTTDGTDLFLHAAAGYHFTISPNVSVWPVASTAILLRYTATPDVTLRAGAFHADEDTLDEADVNNDGLRFGWDASQTLYIAEAEVASEVSELSGIFRLGAWFDTNDAEDLGGRDEHDEGVGAYVAADHEIWREPGSEAQGARLMFQYGWAPDDRSEIDLDLTGGVAYTGLVPGRDSDQIGLGYFRPRLSRELRDADPAAHTESAIELTYRADVRAGLTLQGSLQYVLEPGGASGADLDDAFLIGLRTEIRF